MGVAFENFVWWTITLDVVSRYQVIVILKAIFENLNFHKPYIRSIGCFRHFDVRRTRVISSSRDCNQPLYGSAWSSNTLCRVPFPQELLHSFREVKCVQDNSKTLRVGIWNFKSRSHFLKVWCGGYIPDLLNRLPNVHSYFMLIFNCLFMKVEFRINGGISSYFVCWGYEVVWERYVVISQSHHFVLVFTRRGVIPKESISSVLWQKLIKHVPNIQPSVFNSFHMTLIHGELHRIFTRPPFCTGTLQRSSKR